MGAGNSEGSRSWSSKPRCSTADSCSVEEHTTDTTFSTSRAGLRWLMRSIGAEDRSTMGHEMPQLRDGRQKPSANVSRRDGERRGGYLNIRHDQQPPPYSDDDNNFNNNSKPHDHDKQKDPPSYTGDPPPSSTSSNPPSSPTSSTFSTSTSTSLTSSTFSSSTSTAPSTTSSTPTSTSTTASAFPTGFAVSSTTATSSTSTQSTSNAATTTAASTSTSMPTTSLSASPSSATMFTNAADNIGISPTNKDINFDRTSTEAAALAGSLVGLAVIFTLGFFLYRRRHRIRESFEKKKRNRYQEPFSVSGASFISGPLRTPEDPSKDGGLMVGVSSIKSWNPEKSFAKSTDPEALIAPKPRRRTISRIRAMLAAPLSSNPLTRSWRGSTASQDAWPTDINNKANQPTINVKDIDIDSNDSDSIESGSTHRLYLEGRAGDRQGPKQNYTRSVRTASSAAIEPGRIRSQLDMRSSTAQSSTMEEPFLEPPRIQEKSFFSWGSGSQANFEAPQTPAYPQKPTNVYQTLVGGSPSRNQRDTIMTTTTEASERPRHRSIRSWVINQQMQRERREDKVPYKTKEMEISESRLTMMSRASDEPIPKSRLNIPSKISDLENQDFSALRSLSNTPQIPLNYAQESQRLPKRLSTPRPPPPLFSKYESSRSRPMTTASSVYPDTEGGVTMYSDQVPPLPTNLGRNAGAIEDPFMDPTNPFVGDDEGNASGSKNGVPAQHMRNVSESAQTTKTNSVFRAHPGSKWDVWGNVGSGARKLL